MVTKISGLIAENASSSHPQSAALYKQAIFKMLALERVKR
jgi:hypothetical protein